MPYPSDCLDPHKINDWWLQDPETVDGKPMSRRKQIKPDTLARYNAIKRTYQGLVAAGLDKHAAKVETAEIHYTTYNSVCQVLMNRRSK